MSVPGSDGAGTSCSLLEAPRSCGSDAHVISVSTGDTVHLVSSSGGMDAVIASSRKFDDRPSNVSFSGGQTVPGSVSTSSSEQASLNTASATSQKGSEFSVDPCFEDEQSPQGSLTVVEPFSDPVSVERSMDQPDRDCSAQSCSIQSTEINALVSPRQKVDDWLKYCETDEALSSTIDQDIEPTALLEAEQGDEEDDDNSPPLNCEEIEQLLNEGRKLLQIDLEEEQHCEDCENNDQVAESKEADDEASLSDTSSFGIPHDHIKRSASLKTGKTPPGTPGRKKFVRFADAMGLELQHIRTFKDEIPTVPLSAFKSLDQNKANAWLVFTPPSRPTFSKRLHALFSQPYMNPDFLMLLRQKKVMMETVVCREEDSQIRCLIRVINLDYNKQVQVRFTFDDWVSWSEREARYVMGSSDGETDRFETTLYASTLGSSQQIQLAVVFTCKGKQYWDNNSGANYRVVCSPAQEHRTQTSPEDWTGGQY